jgi:hypothetical protein
LRNRSSRPTWGWWQGDGPGDGRCSPAAVGHPWWPWRRL